ncbi:peptidase M50 [Opitutaceae bacterium TAV4]|nr:peptidase M50 [Opitutaceae bacterium TAV4]RRJ99174.1 peptidase M50 [Opitutaceae bacterium TAV3]
MMPTHRGSLRLFRFAGIDVFLHWSWFLVAVYSLSTRVNYYHSPLWNVLEYLGLFVIVLLHEFGHALACRQTGGEANLIVLWPLGGVAYVNPPQRPGATLWSIVAGPLVNVVLLPVFFAAAWLAESSGLTARVPDTAEFFGTLFRINLVLLVFNLLPCYPLDGGQILRSLLWFPLGQARSLLVASAIGLAGGVALLGLAWAFGVLSVWIAILMAFLMMNSWQGFQYARAMMRIGNNN